MVNSEAVGTIATKTHSISVIFLVLFMLSASHILLYDYLGIRLLAQILFGGAILILLGPAALRQSYYLNKYSPFAILCLLYIFTEIMGQQEVKNIVGYAGAFFMIMAVSSFSTFKLEYFSKIIAYILLSFSLAGFAQIIMVFIDPTLSGYIIKSIESAYYDKMRIEHPVEWLGNADSLTTLFGISYPRFSSYIDQASALPAYFLLPSAIVLISAIRQKKFAYIPIIFSIASMGGAVAFCLALSVIMYFISRHLPKLLLATLPLILFFVLLTTILIFSDAIRGSEVFEVSESNSHIENYVATRASSSFARIILLLDAIEIINSSFILDINSPGEKFGSLILTSGQRAGFPGIAAAVIAFFMLFRRIASAMHFVRGDAHTSYGLALLYSVAVQAMIYNDYGFSKIWGITMLAAAYVMLQKLPHLSISSQMRLKKTNASSHEDLHYRS